MDIRDGNCKMVTSFTAGSLLGAGIALLVAPQPGRKTRQEIRHFGHMAINKSRKSRLRLWRSMNHLATNVSEKLDRGRQWTYAMMTEFWQTLINATHK